MTKLTDEDKAGLGEAEIAALEEDDEGLDDLKPDDDDAAEAEVKAEADAKAHADEPIFVSLPVVPQEKLASLKQAYDDALEKFDDGDITYAELDEAKDAFNESKWKNNLAQETNQSIVTGRWTREQNSFLNENTGYRDNETLNVAFVTAVNKLIGSDEGAGMSDRQVLEAAKLKVEKDLGFKRGHADIADVAAADEADDKSNDFANLDKLEGAAYQAAIDKLTPSQLERYENTQ